MRLPGFFHAQNSLTKFDEIWPNLIEKSGLIYSERPSEKEKPLRWMLLWALYQLLYEEYKSLETTTGAFS